MTNGPVEPRADLRVSANELRQYFIALVGEGFTEKQALQIVGAILSNIEQP